VLADFRFVRHRDHERAVAGRFDHQKEAAAILASDDAGPVLLGQAPRRGDRRSDRHPQSD
jgi:hypothetical protein